jgi:hypothetical protein
MRHMPHRNLDVKSKKTQDARHTTHRLGAWPRAWGPSWAKHATYHIMPHTTYHMPHTTYHIPHTTTTTATARRALLLLLLLVVVADAQARCWYCRRLGGLCAGRENPGSGGGGAPEGGPTTTTWVTTARCSLQAPAPRKRLAPSE